MISTAMGAGKMAKNYPVLYTVLVWLGVVVFGFVTFYGVYILSLVPEIPASEVTDREVVVQTGAAIVALGATSLVFVGMSLWRNRDMSALTSRTPPKSRV